MRFDDVQFAFDYIALAFADSKAALAFDSSAVVESTKHIATVVGVAFQLATA